MLFFDTGNPGLLNQNNIATREYQNFPATPTFAPSSSRPEGKNKPFLAFRSLNVRLIIDHLGLDQFDRNNV